MKIPKQRRSESINAFNKRASLIYRSNGYNIEEIANRLNISETEVYNYVVIKDIPYLEYPENSVEVEYVLLGD